MNFNIKYCGFFILILLGVSYFAYGLEKPNDSLHHESAIIIGASSGIGAALAKELIKQNYKVGITGRRGDLLAKLKDELGPNCYSKIMDVSKHEEARDLLNELIKEMDGMNLIIISAATGTLDLDWEEEKETVNVNVLGFLAMVNSATDYFLKQGNGHIVSISSIAALRGSAEAPTYSASKAFMSNYMAGLRMRLKKLNKSIYLTDIQPGFVDTDMAKAANKFWVATPQEAALEICDAIAKKREHAYVTKKWRLIAWAYKFLPDFLLFGID